MKLESRKIIKEVYVRVDDSIIGMFVKPDDCHVDFGGPELWQKFEPWSKLSSSFPSLVVTVDQYIM